MIVLKVDLVSILHNTANYNVDIVYSDDIEIITIPVLVVDELTQEHIDSVDNKSTVALLIKKTATGLNEKFYLAPRYINGNKIKDLRKENSEGLTPDTNSFITIDLATLNREQLADLTSALVVKDKYRKTL